MPIHRWALAEQANVALPVCTPEGRRKQAADFHTHARGWTGLPTLGDWEVRKRLAFLSLQLPWFGCAGTSHVVAEFMWRELGGSGRAGLLRCASILQAWSSKWYGLFSNSWSSNWSSKSSGMVFKHGLFSKHGLEAWSSSWFIVQSGLFFRVVFTHCPFFKASSPIQCGLLFNRGAWSSKWHGLRRVISSSIRPCSIIC